ncbi:hypothetical protein C1646_675526 [Rhizophagus diaphanus]|nr:hypothetical protein C1646_675526 [Rhizophagus diaphanus] [Rhizophagus sp. MUCL 43196]
MDHVTCPYIFKKDGSICGKTCTYTTGCTKHWELYEKNMKLKPCLVSSYPRYTDSGTGCCPNHSARFHSLNYRMRQKYGAEALQPAKTSELSDGLGLFDEALQPRIVTSGNIPKAILKGSAQIINSDGEDMSIDLFGISDEGFCGIILYKMAEAFTYLICNRLVLAYIK